MFCTAGTYLSLSCFIVHYLIASHITLRAARLCSGGLAAESALLLATVAELATQGVGSRESFADALKVLLGHGAMPPFLNTSAARVIGEADERTVLIGVKILGIGHGADAALILLNILLEESSTLGPSNRGVQAVTASTLNAVVAKS